MRTAIPLETGLLHFVGIGGIGMSGIAEILHNLGYSVQGSDASDSANVKRLRKLGIEVFIGQKPSNVENAKVVVISTAIKADNPEVQAARDARIPVVRRAEMLAELLRLKWSIAIGGTHGKTTTTTLTASILDAAQYDPTVINGGIIKAYESNTHLGEGDWIVVEADESDGTFLRLRPTISVVTNIDPEHLDHYGDFDALKDAFVQFIHQVPFYGCGVVCIDHPNVQALMGQVTDRKLITYGFSPQADIRAENVEVLPIGSRFDIHLPNDKILKGVTLPMPGQHNVSNALAAVGVAWQLQIDASAIRQGLAQFSGVGRRFTHVGDVDGITIIDDYGHHPTEIKAVLGAARERAKNNVIAVIQPHRYSRLEDLWDDFAGCANDADIVLIAPVFAAGEEIIEGCTHVDLVEAMKTRGHKQVEALESLDAIAAAIKTHGQAGDYVLCLGAGNITAYANDLPAQLSSQKVVSQ